MLARKKSFISAIVGTLVALSIIALVLSLVRVEDVMLPPTVKVSPENVPEHLWCAQSPWGGAPSQQLVCGAQRANGVRICLGVAG